MTLTELADRIERAGADEQRELLGQAAKAVWGWSICPEGVDPNLWVKRWVKFNRLLDVEAYLGAAMMLTGEMRWIRPDEWPMDFCKPVATICPLIHNEDNPTYTATGDTLALALTAASLRARSEQR